MQATTAMALSCYKKTKTKYLKAFIERLLTGCLRQQQSVITDRQIAWKPVVHRQVADCCTQVASL